MNVVGSNQNQYKWKVEFEDHTLETTILENTKQIE